MRRHAITAAVTVAIVATLAASAQAADTSRLQVPLPPNMPTITYAPCPAYIGADQAIGGCAYTDPAAIAAGQYGDSCRNTAGGCIYLENRDQHTLLHELGHAWDEQVLSHQPGAREWFAARLGRGGEAWNGAGDHSPASEVFADTYANCAVGNGMGQRSGRWESAYDTALSSPRAIRRICVAIQMLGL